MFIVCNFGKEAQALITMGAATVKEEVKTFTNGCFDRTSGDIPVTEVIFIGHGSRNRFGGNNDEEESGLAPGEFVKSFTTPPRKLPPSVKNLVLCACHIGLIHPPSPSYIARVAEELGKYPEYKHVAIRGLQVENYDKKYSHLLQTQHLDEETNKHLIIDYYLLTKEEYEVRKQYREEHQKLVENTEKLRINIKKLTNEIIQLDANNGKNALLKEKKALLLEIKKMEKIDPNQIEKSQVNPAQHNQLNERLENVTKKLSEIDQNPTRKQLKEDRKKLEAELEQLDIQILKKKEDTRSFKKILSTSNIKEELMQDKYIVTPIAAEIQRTEMSIRQLKYDHQEIKNQLNMINDSIQSLKQTLSELSAAKTSSGNKRPLTEVEETEKKKSTAVTKEQESKSKIAEIKERLQEETAKSNKLNQDLQLLEEGIRKEDIKLNRLYKDDNAMRETIALRSMSFKKKSVSEQASLNSLAKEEKEPPRSSYGMLLPKLGVQPSLVEAKPPPPPPTALAKPTASLKILPSALMKAPPVPKNPAPAEKKQKPLTKQPSPGSSSSNEPPPPSSSSFKPS